MRGRSHNIVLTLSILFISVLSYGQTSELLFTSKLDRLPLPSDSLVHMNQPKQILFNPVKKLPIFCHIEDLIEKNAKLPVRIRLGSVNYVDRLEKKVINP